MKSFRKRHVLRLKGKLEGHLRRVTRWIDALKRDPSEEFRVSWADNTPYTEETDSMMASEMREAYLDLLGRLMDKEAKLTEALYRLEDGSYGLCQSCETFIDRERLEALPEAVLCLSCQEAVERSAGGSARGRDIEQLLRFAEEQRSI